MRPTQWPRLASLFAAEKEKRGISLKDFCVEHGLNYGTAKKHISVRKAAGKAEMKPHPSPEHIPQIPLKDGKKLLRAKKKSPLTKDTLKVTKESTKGEVLIADDFGVSDREFLFARLIAQGRPKYVAFTEAGFQWNSPNKPYAESSRIARKPRVRRAIYWFKEQVQRRYNLQFDQIIHQLVAIAEADPNEISQYRRVNCRYCYGENHHYQWRDLAEQQAATVQAAKNNQPPPNLAGGLGYSDQMDPHPGCPRCGGEGKGMMFIADTRDVEGDARYLLEGVTMTKFGASVVTASKMEARKELARIYALRNQPNETEEMLALRAEILREELRKKRAEANRLEAENALNATPTNGKGEATYVIEIVNSPDSEGVNDDPIAG